MNSHIIDHRRIALSAIVNRLVEDQSSITGVLRQRNSIGTEYVCLAIAIFCIYITSSRWLNYQVQLIDAIAAAYAYQRIVIDTWLTQQLTTEVIFLTAADCIVNHKAILRSNLQVLDIY